MGERKDDINIQDGHLLQKAGIALFADLLDQLNSSTKTNDKLNALSTYFTIAPPPDKVWVIAIFSGRRPKRIVSSSLLLEWCCELKGLPEWLFAESYHSVGDLAETISLILDENVSQNSSLMLSWYMEQFIKLEKQAESIKKDFILNNWTAMSQPEIFVFNKLITGNFRIGISQKMMVNALSKIVDLSPSVIAHRIIGNWDPATANFDELLSIENNTADISRPYPFYLAYALDEGPELLGDPNEWQAEWKWDGIRGQVIKRNKELFVWSRGEELMTEKFPEYFILKDLLPDGIVLDGEIIPARNGSPLPFAILQTRIGRKTIANKQLTEAPIAFFVYDLLEFGFEDWRSKPLVERRMKLQEVLSNINHPVIQISPIIEFENWKQLEEIRKQSRDNNSEGIMLKRKTSMYEVGRKRGDWWKWKIEPLTIDGVLIYAQKGSGRRSSLYTDYTFAVKDGDKLVSFTKAYSGLTDKEFAQVDNFVKRNSIEKFGPVRTVKPELVFEIAFEGISASARHKSGVALRFPRMKRWRHDKKADEINTLDDLKALLAEYGK